MFNRWTKKQQTWREEGGHEGGNEGSNSPITHRKMARNCDFGDILSDFATATIEQNRLSLNKERYPLKTLHATSSSVEA